MALAKTLRNRIVGFLIIISVLLISLPALLSHDGKKSDAGRSVVAVNSHGAVTTDDGLLQGQAASDYAALLAPEDDTNEGLISENPALLQTPTGPHQGTALPDAIPAPAPARASAQSQTQAPAKSATQSPATGAPEQLVAAPRPAAPAPSAAPKSAPREEILVANAPSSSAASKQALTGNPKTSAYTVQVGVFSQKSNADKLVAALKKAGLNAIEENVQVNGKNLIRVYAGGAANRNDLNEALALVQSTAKVQGKIVSVK